jgi:hypothetical protein
MAESSRRPSHSSENNDDDADLNAA